MDMDTSKIVIVVLGLDGLGFWAFEMAYFEESWIHSHQTLVKKKFVDGNSCRREKKMLY